MSNVDIVFARKNVEAPEEMVKQLPHCPVCGAKAYLQGNTVMLKAKRMESHNERDMLGYIIGVKYRWARIDLCESCYNEIVRSCHRIRREQKEGL